MAWPRENQSRYARIGAIKHGRVGNRVWGLSMLRKRSGQAMARHNPLHCARLTYYTRHVRASRLRRGLPEFPWDA